jgi:hypothetical protein
MKVTQTFTYYDDGCFPTVHAVGEDVAGEVADFALSQGFAISDPVGEEVVGEVAAKPSGKKGK